MSDTRKNKETMTLVIKVIIAIATVLLGALGTAEAYNWVLQG